MQNNGEDCYVAFILDITEKKEAEQKIYFHANHDQLTGLTNRFYFKEYLCQLLSSLSYQDDENTNLAVIYFDVDKFQDKLWSEYQSKGMLITEFGKKIVVENATRNKVFNYFVSALSKNLSHFKARYSCIKVT